MGIFQKSSKIEGAFATFQVAYFSGLPSYPKKVKKSTLSLLPDGFHLVGKGLGPVQIAYTSVTGLELTSGESFGISSMLGDAEGRNLSRDNHILIGFLDDGGQEQIVRLMMESGTVALGQAMLCQQMVGLLEQQGKTALFQG